MDSLERQALRIKRSIVRFVAIDHWLKHSMFAPNQSLMLWVFLVASTLAKSETLSLAFAMCFWVATLGCWMLYFFRWRTDIAINKLTAQLAMEEQWSDDELKQFLQVVEDYTQHMQEVYRERH